MEAISMLSDQELVDIRARNATRHGSQSYLSPGLSCSSAGDCQALLAEVDRLRPHVGYFRALATGHKKDVEWMRKQIAKLRLKTAAAGYKWEHLNADIDKILAMQDL
jgi:hypothetical protein